MARELRFTVFLLGLLMTCLQPINSSIGDNSVKKVEGISSLDGEAVSIHIEKGIIKKIERKILESKQKGLIYVAPGLIDIQVNGYAGVDFSAENLTIDGVARATMALWREGVTTFFPTIISNSHSRIKKNMAILSEAAEKSHISLSIAGFHLEGPYISALDGYRGAHLKQWVRPPDWAEFLEYQRASGGRISLVTLAPEIEGALVFIKRCIDNNILVAIGHTSAGSDAISRAVSAGASISTHLGNGCANMIHRHLNPLWPQLAEDRLTATIIADGHHLRPEEVQVFYRVKGSERTCLVSDVMALAGMPPGEYTSGGKQVVLTADGMLKYPAQNVLAGAAAPLRTGVANIIRFTGCSLAEAIRMASGNQAKLFKLTDRGEIEIGKRADLIQFTLENGEVKVIRTLLAGRVVFADKRADDIH